MTEKSVFDTEFQQEDITSKTVVGLERISEAFRVLLWEHAKVIGLSPIQIQLLIFVAHHDEKLCQVSYLAREFNMTKPTISDAVRVLVNKELLDKQPSSDDGRVFAVALTHQGSVVVEQTQHFANPIKAALDTLEPSAQRQLFGQLSKLIYMLNQTGILTVQRTCFACRFYEKKPKQDFCHLLRKPLRDQDIRVDCPEYEPRPSGSR